MPEARKRCKLHAGGITVVIVTLNLFKSGLRVGLVKLIQSLSDADQSDYPLIGVKSISGIVISGFLHLVSVKPNKIVMLKEERCVINCVRFHCGV